MTTTPRLAPPATTCQPNGFACEADNGRPAIAVHTHRFHHLCAYHSPYDAPKEPTMPAPARRTYPDWFLALLNRNQTMAPRQFEALAYQGHIQYALSMTDGQYRPEGFDAWVINFRKAPIANLFAGNDLRHTLAPCAFAYIATL